MTTPLVGPQIDLTTDMPPEEARAAANHPSAELVGPAVALASEEDPLTGGGATAAAKAATEGAPTSEGDEEIPPTSGAEAAPSGSAGPARRGGAGSVRSRGFLTYDSRAAERLLTGACPPKLRAEFGQLGSSTVAEDAFAALLWAITSVATLRDTAVWTEHADQEVSDARARAEQAESALGAVRREAESALEVARKEAEEAQRALRATQEEMEKVRRQEMANLSWACAAETESERISVELRARQHQLDAVIQEARELEGRAEAAEGAARAADARAADAFARADEALQRATAAERAAGEAVEHFRASTDFAEEVAEGSADAFLLGFREGVKKAARVSNIASLGDLEPDDSDESDGPFGGKPAPSDA